MVKGAARSRVGDPSSPPASQENRGGRDKQVCKHVQNPWRAPAARPGPVLGVVTARNFTLGIPAHRDPALIGVRGQAGAAPARSGCPALQPP